METLEGAEVSGCMLGEEFGDLVGVGACYLEVGRRLLVEVLRAQEENLGVTELYVSGERLGTSWLTVWVVDYGLDCCGQ